MDDTRRPAAVGSNRGVRRRICCALIACGIAATYGESSDVAAQTRLQTGAAGEPRPISEIVPGSQDDPDLAPPIENGRATPLPGADQEVVEVRIEGNVTIPSSAIAKYIKTRPERPATQQQIRADVRALYGTRWFFSVEPRFRASDKGMVLVYRVLERPILRNVEYRGADKIKVKQLAAITGLKVGSPYDVSANRESARRLEEHYHEKGFTFATVKLEKGGSQDDREVVFAITEGPKVRVTSVKFDGNEDFSDGILNLKLKTKKAILWTFGGKYDPATIKDDIASLKQYYHSLGYFDVSIEHEVHFSEDRSRVQLRYTVDEGQRYKVRRVEFAGNQIFDERQLREDITLTENQPFNARHLAKDINSIKDRYNELGRLFAKVNATPRFLEEPGVADLVYNIDEDKVYRIRRIDVNIRGDNPHTKRAVALNRVLVAPGDLASQRKIELSERRLGGSPIFERDGQAGPRVSIVRVRAEESADPVQTVRGQSEDARPGDSAAGRATLRGVGSSATSRPGNQNPGSSAGRARVSGPQTSTALPTPQQRFGHVAAADFPATLSSRRVSGAGHSRIADPVDMARAERLAAQLSTMTANRQYSGAPSSTSTAFASPRPDSKAAWPTNPEGVVRTASDESAAEHEERAIGRVVDGLFQPVGTPIVRWQPDPEAAPTDDEQSLVENASIGYVIRGQTPNEPVPYLSPQGDPLIDRPGEIDLTFDVTEARTGRLMFGVGVNSDAGVVGSIVLSEDNFDILRPPRSFADIVNGTAFRGAGQKFRLEAAPGDVVSRYLVSWSDPFFMNTNYSLGVSGFFYNRFFPDWDEQRGGGRVSVGRQWNHRISTSVAVRLEDIEIENPSSPTPQSLTRVLGNSFLSTVRLTVADDTRDSPYLPGEGHYISASVEQAFGDFDYPRLEGEARQYFTVFSRPDGGGRHVLSVGGNVGWTDSGTPIFEKFYAGGFQTFRGFDFRGVGPREFDVAVGGRWMALGSVEYMFPVMANESVALVAFSDFGTVEDDVALDNFRLSVGAGVRITVPALGPVPLAFDWAFPVLSEDFDDERIFSFYVGLNR